MHGGSRLAVLYLVLRKGSKFSSILLRATIEVEEGHACLIIDDEESKTSAEADHPRAVIVAAIVWKQANHS
jgi:hypothetical protein